MRNSERATNYLVALFCLLGAVLPSGLLASTEQTEAVEKVTHSYFALADENNAPLREAKLEFDCTDKIYAVTELSGYLPGQYDFSVKWKDPSGTQREHTQYPFHVHNKREHRLWAWLLLSRARGAGMLTFINPAAGLEEFIGEWTVEVSIDNEVVNSNKFIVSC